MEKGLISVDRWAGGSQAYFLTHLSSACSHAPLFCSLLRILHVTVIDACHCPGSIMLLFRGDFGRVLYTGDFRWEATCERATQARHVLRHALIDFPAVDVVYLYNTYSHPVIEIISAHPDHDVIIGINTLGKEDLLVEISRVVKIKVSSQPSLENEIHQVIMIWVWPERLRTMHLLGHDDIFTTDTTLTRGRAVPQYSFSFDTVEALNRIVRPTIGIMPSGLPWIKKPLQKNEHLSGSFLTSPYKRAKCSENNEAQNDKQIRNTGSPEKFHKYIYSVPYSDHSNYEEIEDFIKLVQPTSLKGIVSSSSCDIEPKYYFGRLCRVNQQTQPEEYKRKESCKRVEAVKSKTSFGGDNVVAGRDKGKGLKGKSSGVLSRFSVLRRKNRGVKIHEDYSSEL